MEKQFGHGFTILKRSFGYDDDALIQQMIFHCNKQSLCVSGDGDIKGISKILKSIYPIPELIIKQVFIPSDIELRNRKNRLNAYFEVLRILQPHDPDICFSRDRNDTDLFQEFISVYEI